MCLLSHVWLFATLWTAAHQYPLPMEFSRQEYWSGLLFPPPGIFPTQGLNPHLLHFLHWQAVSFPLEPPGKPQWLALCDMTNAWLYRITVHHQDGWEGQLWLQRQVLQRHWAIPATFPISELLGPIQYRWPLAVCIITTDLLQGFSVPTPLFNYKMCISEFSEKQLEVVSKVY